MSRVELAKARVSDWAKLLAWRNDQRSVEQSFTGVVSPQEHWQWLQAVLVDDAVDLFLAIDATTGFPVGTGRLNYVLPDRVELSVTVAPEARGSRWSGLIVDALVERHLAKRGGEKPELRVVARVKPSNYASLRAFARSRFVPTGFTPECVTLERVP